MWSTMRSPQGHNYPTNFLPSSKIIDMKGQQYHRDFGLFTPHATIVPGKGFRNPNFVNNFNKYQPVDSSGHNNNVGKNSCHTIHHIIDSIKERCPEVIPPIIPKEELNKEISPPESMCLDNKHRKREHTAKKKRQMGKKSRHNMQKNEIKELMQMDDSLELSNHSLDSSFSPKPHSLHLKDFLVPLSDSIQAVTKVCVTLEPTNPLRARQYSVTDSEDSFIIFDSKEIEEGLKKDSDKNESPGYRRSRLPSTCESEDSFILFEGDDLDSMEDDEGMESSSRENSDLDDSSLDENETDDDEEDSSFCSIELKRVRFASPEKLCEVHPMVKWSYAYQAARKGPWEMHARDRARFKERIHRVERDIEHIFTPQHRDRIYKERFVDI